jgi:dihydroceramidase
MYLLITFALLYGVARRSRIRAGVAMVTYIVWNAALLGFQMSFPDMRRYVFGLLVLGVLAIEARFRRTSGGTIESRWLSRAAAVLGLAFLLWVLDITKVVCSPESTLQGHAMWHVLGALAGWCLYRYYESETVLMGQTVTHHT